MISRNLFDEVLCKPAREGFGKLDILSGYSHPSMPIRHVDALRELKCEVEITLTIGMIPESGLSVVHHRGFQSVSQQTALGLKVRYLREFPSSHAKLYLWTHADGRYLAFIGSANYSQNGFLSQRRQELLAEIDPADPIAYLRQIDHVSIDCDSLEADALVATRMPRPSPTHPDDDGDSVRLPLFIEDENRIHERAGLNWGQRAGREPNQAYIPVPAEVQRLDFFPARGVHFEVETDDGEILYCVRAQDEGKAIETSLDNSVLGRYFRRRLGLQPGQFVTLQDLDNYGARYVTFVKLDPETYRLVFAPDSRRMN